MTTRVIFLVRQGTPEVFAYFPDDALAYAHVGQHSSCHPDYAIRCRLATEEQYRDLKTELESLGYDDLRVMNDVA